MMPAIVLKGDKTSSGGIVQAGSSLMNINGVPIARKGDKVSCPTHGDNVIAEGCSHYDDNGIPVALHGHRCACGCTLVASSGALVE